MAEYDDEEEAIVHPADPPQQLVDFVGSFTDPQAAEVFGDAAVRVQDYIVQRNIAAENDAAANRLVSNLGTFKDGLVGMAQNDPAAVFLGLDLVPGIVEGIVETHPYLPDDQRAATAEQLSAEMRQEIARAGVMSLADRDADAARAMLGRVSDLFDEGATAGLTGYIGSMEMARNVDATALEQQRARDTAQTTAASTTHYLGALVDPVTQGLQFPAGWAQRVMADPSIPPADTAGMLGIYDRLQRTGDAAQSDPYLVADVIQRIASGNAPATPEILAQAGSGLRLADAVSLAKNAGSATPAARKEMTDLAHALDTARSTLASLDNGPAGQVAFGRFVNWFVNSYPPGALDPNAQRPYDLSAAMMRFSPTSDDLVRAVVPPSGERKPLDQIFGRR